MKTKSVLINDKEIIRKLEKIIQKEHIKSLEQVQQEIELMIKKAYTLKE